MAQKDDSVVTQYTMTTLEELGLLKMDFLGLRTLTVIDNCEKLIKKRESEFSVKEIDFTDKETYEMFGRGDTEGVFQFESGGLKNVLMQFKPTSLEDLIALTSLYRPGPMDSIPTYIHNKNNPGDVKYKTPELTSILDVTYGCMVYQEQVMQICTKLAGYSLGRADIVRRAMSKKKHDVMLEERGKFVEGCVKNNISEDAANSIFDDMVSFASYAFNKSHAACYANLAFQTAYLKCHYPAEFMASQITSFLSSPEKISEYVADCTNNGITVVPPHVNRSFGEFTVEDGQILFGLLGVKGLGRNFINDFIREREVGGPYTSFYEFLKRNHGQSFNRKAAEALIKCGALDGLDCNRRQMLTALPDIASELDNDRRRNVEGQIGLFDMDSNLGVQVSGPSIPDLPEFSKMEILSYEKETTGLYISGHPMQDYVDAAKSLKSAKVSELISATEEETSKYHDNDAILLLCMISGVHVKLTKAQQTMATALAEDVSGAIELTFFPKTFAQFGSLLRENAVFVVDARLSVSADEKPSLKVTRITPYVKNDTPKKKKSGIFVRFDSKDDPRLECVDANLADAKSGDLPIFYYFLDEKRYSEVGCVDQNLSHEICEKLTDIMGEGNVVLQ